MRVLLATMLVLSSATISLSHEIYFGDTRVPGSVQATWKPDGTQFATWGSSPYVEIWRVSDGLRLMVLDHVAPIQIFISPTAFIADMSWSDDGQTITTVIHSNNHESLVHQQRWSATTGELLYSFVVATANVHMPNAGSIHTRLSGARNSSLPGQPIGYHTWISNWARHHWDRK